MKLSKAVILAPVALISLASCSLINKRYEEKEYVVNYYHAKGSENFDGTGEFNILQLSDIHMSLMDDCDLHYKFIEETVNRAETILGGKDKLHLIAISGDVFTFAGKDTVKELCAKFESFGIPWTLTFGNHDEQGYFSVSWMTEYLTQLSNREDSHLLFVDHPDDDVYGSANFVIDITGNTSSQPRQIVMLDSNRYNYGEGFGYDYIHYDQIDWYQRMTKYFNKQYDDEGTNKPVSLAFFHIPVPEFKEAYDAAPQEGKGTNATFLKGNIYEDGTVITKEDVTRNVYADKTDGSPKKNTGFFKAALESDYLKGCFVGHAHTNSYCVDYHGKDGTSDSNSISLCYGAKSTDRVYMDEDMLGGQLIRFHDSADSKVGGRNIGMNWFDVDLIYHKYSDLEEGK